MCHGSDRSLSSLAPAAGIAVGVGSHHIHLHLMERLRSPLRVVARRLLIAVGAGAAGYLINGFPVMLVNGLLLALGQVPSVGVALALGPWFGLLAGAMGALRFAMWGQDLTFLLLCGEVLVVGYLARRRAPLIADLAYWIGIATPIQLVQFLLVRNMPFATVSLVLTKNILAGMFCASIAAVIVGRPVLMNPARLADARGSLITIINRRVSAVLAMPVVLIIVTISTISQRNDELGAYEHLRLESMRYAAMIEDYVRSHTRTVSTVAAVLRSGAVKTQGDRQAYVEAIRRANPSFISILATDSAGRVLLAAWGTRAPLSSIKALPSVVDRPYFAEPMRTNSTYVSGVFLGRAIGSDTLFAVSAPIIGARGAPIGVVEGSLPVSDFAQAVATPSDVRVTVIDADRRVIYSSAGQRWPTLASLPPSVKLDAPKGTGRLWDDDPSALTVQREQLYEVASTAHGWSVLVDMPRYAALRQTAVDGTILFSASLVIFFIVLVGVRAVNTAVARPLAELESRAVALDWSAPASAERPLSMHTAPREVAVVGDALHRASIRLHRAFEQAQQAVADRDRALTEREATLRDLDGLVRSRTNELEVARDRAESSSRAKSAFLASMSHELRTPLNVILGQSEALEEGIYGPVNDRQAMALAEIDGQGQHLLALISEILDLARIESGKFAVELRPATVTPILEDVVGAFRDAARKGNITLSLSAAQAEPVLADAMRLRQVLLNLVGNAVKFTPAGGAVTITLELTGDGRHPAAVRVTDTGVGIPDEQQSRIFEAFEQGGQADGQPRAGSGLGLAISRSLCEAMGMRLTLESRVGDGSTFTVAFPQHHRGRHAPPHGAAEQT